MVDLGGNVGRSCFASKIYSNVLSRSLLDSKSNLATALLLERVFFALLAINWRMAYFGSNGRVCTVS